MPTVVEIMQMSPKPGAGVVVKEMAMDQVFDQGPEPDAGDDQNRDSRQSLWKCVSRDQEVRGEGNEYASLNQDLSMFSRWKRADHEWVC